MGDPFTAPNALRAMHKAAEDGLSTDYSSTRKNPELSWEVARCLLSEKQCQFPYLADAVIYGALPKSEKHADAIEVLTPLFRENVDSAKPLTAKLWSALAPGDKESKDNNALSWGAAQVLIGAVQLSPEGKWWISKPKEKENEEEEDVETADKLLRVLRVVMRKIGSEPMAREFLQSLLQTPQTTVPAGRALVALLDDNTPEVAFEAARALVLLGDLEHLSLAVTACKHGLGRESTHEQATQIIDTLRSVPSMTQAVRTALLLTAWGKDEEAAPAAAAYLMDKVDPASPAIPRGLIHGRWRWRKGRAQDTIQRLQTLLSNPVSKPSTVDAMLAALYQEERHSSQFDLVALLVRAGVPLYDRILAAMTEASKYGMAVAPLALIALTGRQQEALEGANRFGYLKLANLLAG